MATTTTTGRTCPNCATFVPPARSICPTCKLQVSKMDAFESAKRAAESKGFGATKIVDPRGPFYRRPGTIVLALLLLLLVGGGVYWYTRPAPPPAWTKFALTKEDAVKELLSDIATGQDDAYLHAYSRLDPAVKDKSIDDEKGLYRQLFHVMFRYLSGEFGDNWVNNTQLSVDPNDPDRIVAKIGLETLHVRVAMMTPKDKLAAGEPEHWAVQKVEEFPIEEASGFQSNAARMAVIEGVAGHKAVENLNIIMGANRGRPHQTPMQRKVELLPILRDPRETVYRTIMQAYPLKDDPVVRARLEAIKSDTRYDNNVREGADQVLTDKVPEGVLEGLGLE